MKRPASSCVLAAALLLGGAGASLGAVRTWDGGGVGNNWSTAGNWDLDTLPVAGDEVVFNGTSGKNCTVDSAPASLSTFTVGAYTGVITFSVDGVTGQDLTVAETFSLGGGTVVFAGKAAVPPNGLGWTLRAKNLTVGLTTVMHADGQGFAAQNGPGQGTSGAGASGSGHGGKGGAGSTNAVVGETYGKAASPGSLGSGSVMAAGGAGGGAIKLVVTGTATVNGRLSADGDSSAAVSGASGGSIWILGGGKLTGTGIIRALGGNANAGYGGGGGGRIDISSVTSAFTGTLSAAGGTGFAAGQAGTTSPEPATVSNLAVAGIVSTGLGASSMTVTLTWTSPGEDGLTGALNGSFDLRYSTTAPLVSTSAYFAAPFQVLIATSASPGSLQGASLAFLDVRATHYFALTVVDSSGTRSGLSVGATAQAYVRTYGDAGGTAVGITAGDVDGDGDVDLVEARSNGGVHVLRNDGALAFTDLGQSAGTLNEANGVSLGDLDRDGKLDIVVANTTGLNEQVLRGTGTAAFSLLFSTGGASTLGVAWGDYDNDGRVDFAAANYGNTDEYVAHNNGDGTFSTTTLLGTGKDSTAVAWADYDLDGRLDLAIANDSGQAEVIAHNNGNGTFSTSTLAGTAGNSTSLAWGDYDGDGYPDLAIGNTAGQDEVLVRNNGNGTFTVVSPNPFAGFGGDTTAVAWGDYDGDGDLDLLVTNSSGQSAIYRNDGGGVFTKVLLPGTAGNSSGGVWADLDGDGDLDIAIATNSATQLVTLRNDAALSLSSPSAPSAGFTAAWAEDSVNSASGTLTLAWGAAADNTTPAADLLYWVRVGTNSGGSEFMRVPPANSERGRSRLFADRLAAGSPGVRLTGVPKGGPVYWAVTAEDAGYLRGAASAQQTADLTPPAAVTLSAAQDTVVETSSAAWVALTFNAPGEDGSSGNLLSGALYDVRWSSAGALDTAPKYASAPYQGTFAAAGTAGAAVTLRVAVDPGKTWFFALTTKDSLGARSAVSNSASVFTRIVRERVDNSAPFAVLQGVTTGFLRVKLWTEGAATTAELTKVRVRKFGTLPDAAISNVGLYLDAGTDGAFTAADELGLLTGPVVFVSSAATLTLPVSQTIGTSTNTFFVAATIRPDFLPVDGASVSLRLDGEAVSVRGGGVEQVDLPAFKFDGVDDRVTAPYTAALDVGGGGQVALEAWVRSSDTARANASIIARANAAGTTGYRLWLGGTGCSPGVPSFFVGSSVLCAANGAGQVVVTDGRWHHVAAVYNALVGQFFLDGVALATGPMVGTLTDSASDLGVGGPNSSGGAYFLGELDEVRVSNFARYPLELPPLKRNGTTGAVALYHFDGLVPENLEKDSSSNNLASTVQGQARGYARSTGTAVTDTQDVVFGAVSSLLPPALFRNDQNIAVMRLQLWTTGDFALLDQLTLTSTGTSPAASVSKIKLFLDDGDGIFSATLDSQLAGDQTFSGSKATFSLLAAGAEQVLSASTKTYFVAWNISGSAQNNSNIGVVIASTADLVLSGSVDAVSPAAFPLASGTAPIVAASALVSAETSTGAWLNVSSVVFRGGFGAGNINHFHWVWDQAPGTLVNGAEVPVWIAGKTTVTATSDNINWYFHARAFDTFDIPGNQIDLGPFWLDQTVPAGSGFLSKNSTGGVLAEAQTNDLALGVTVQLTVADQAGASGLSLAGPAPYAPVAGTVGLWHLDEAAGNWVDAGPASNTLFPVGSPARGPGRFKTGLLLDGLSFSSNPAPAGIPLGAAARTLEAWVNPASTAGVQSVLSYGAASCGGGITLSLSSGVLTGSDNCASFSAGPALSTGSWHHVALTYDGATARLFGDGALAGSSSTALATLSGPLRVGEAVVGGQGLRGGVDEARILDHEQSAAAVAADAQRGDPYYASVSTDAGRSWRTVASTVPAAGPAVALSGAQGSVSPETLTVSGLQLVVSTYTQTGASGTNQVRFFFADVAGNVGSAGPFTVLVDTNAPVAVSTPSLPGNGRYTGLKPDFYWTGPSTALVQGLGGTFVLQVSSQDPTVASNIVISVSTPALASDLTTARVTGVYISTFTLGEGATYYWRVRSRSSLGVFGPWGPVRGFVTDVTSPTAAAFRVYNSTGGVFGETGPIDLLSGVTVQFTVADGVSGLGQALDISTAPGMLAYWPFSERSGTTALDSAVGLAGTLTCFGAGCQPARYGITPFGAGLKLGGAQYMSAPSASFQFPAASTFTVSAWIRPNSVSGVDQAVAAVGDPLTPAGSNWVFWVNNIGALRVTNATGGGAQTAGGLILGGAWQHVAAVVEGTTVRFYVNGAQRSVQSWSGNSGGGTMAFTVGAGLRSDGVTADARFNGDIDEVRVLGYAADAAAVAAQYSAASPGRFAVEYSTTAGAAWNVVSATSPGAGLAWVSQSGPDGSLGPETVTVRDLRLGQSTTSAAGAQGTNLVRILSADRRGNFTFAGPFTVLVDTVAAAAVSTPTLPSPGAFVGTRPTFAWDGPSTATAVGMGAAASFLLEVDDQADFSSPEIVVSTPVVVTATASLTTQGVYLSTFSLSEGTTYYWRVRARDYLGLASPALTAASFVTDFSSPTGGGFFSFNSTGGAVGEGTGLELASGVTVQVTVQDAGPAGLSLAGLGGAGAFGVMVTTSGAAQWNDGGWAPALGDAGQTAFRSLARYQGSLYGGTTGGKVWGFDGGAWGPSATLPQAVMALEAFGGKLYAGLAATGQVREFNGVAWSTSATLDTAVDVRALRAYAGRLYAGDSAGRVWGFDPALGNWYVAFQSTSVVIESLEVYDGRLYAGANPNIFAFDGTSWNVTANISAAVLSMKVYDNKLYAATKNNGQVFQFDGSAWSVSLPFQGQADCTALGVHAGRLYAAIDNPSAGRFYAYDTKSWSLVRVLPNVGDRALAFSPFGGRLYAGLQQASGAAGVLVSTPLAVSLSGSEGTSAAQVLSASGLDFAQTSVSNVCQGAAGCVATNQVRFTYLDRAGRVGQAGPFAVLVDSLLSQPTAYFPAAGGFIRDTLPDFAWLENNPLPTHVVQVSTAANFSALAANFTSINSPINPGVALTNGATYFWRVKARNAFGVESSFSDPASFTVDVNVPSTSAYQQQNSTGGALAEAQLTNLAAGATFTLTVRDPASGLALEPLASDYRVGAWSFEGSSIAVADFSGAGRDAALDDVALRTAAGYRGAGLAFPSGGSAMNMPATAGLPWSGVTVMGWVKPTVNGAGRRTLWATSRDQVYYTAASGRVLFAARGTGSGGCAVQTSSAFPLGAWTHVAFVADPVANKNILYVNGQPAASCAGAAAAGDTALRVGADGLTGLGGTEPFDGSIDEVRAFYAPLGPAAIARELGGAPFAVLFSTNAGASWTAAASTGPAGPRLAFTGASGSTAPEGVRALGLSLHESTNTTVCAQASPCGATNQLLFYMPDRAGGVRTAGPFAVIIDTSVPLPTLTSLTPTATDQVFATASSTDNLAGLRDFLFEASSSPAFDAALSSSGFVAQTSYTLTGLLDATTYFVRVWARDNLLNISTPSVSLATASFGTVFLTTVAAPPGGALQGALVSMATLHLATKAGSTSRLLSLRVRRTGTSQDSDVDLVQLYSESDGNGVFSPADTLQAQAALAQNEAVLMLAGSGAPLDVLVSTFHVVFKVAPGAITDRTVGLEISSSTSVGLKHPARAAGTFPVTAPPRPITDGANVLTVIPTSLAPAGTQPGTDDIPLLMLNSVTDTGTSIISSITVTMSGTMPTSKVRSINVWRDAGVAGDAVFDRNADIRLTPDTDTFGLGSTATVNLTGFDVSSRTVDTSNHRFFITVSLAADAPQDTTFRISIASTSDVVLRNPVDSVVFASSVAASTVSVILNNTVTVSAADEAPAAFVQGNRFAVMRVTMTVDQGTGQINRFKVRLTGTGQSSDLSGVEVWRDAAPDGQGLSTALDTRVGSAPFTAGLAVVDIATQTLVSGATQVFFLAYLVAPAASPGVTLGALINPGDIRAGNSGTTVGGFTQLVASTRPVTATVNHMVIGNSIKDVSPGSLVQGQQHAAMLRLDVTSDKNDFSWLGVTVERLGTAPDSAVSAVDVYRDFDGNGLFDAAVDSRITNGADVFTASTATLTLLQVQTVAASTKTYFVTVSLAPNAAPGKTLGVRISSTASFSLLAPNVVSTNTAFPIQTVLVSVNQFANTVSLATASVVPGLGAEPGTTDVPLMALTLKTDVSNADLQSLRVDQAGTASDADVRQVKLYYDLNDAGSFDSSNLNNYLQVASTGQSFGSNGAGSVVLTFSSAVVLSPAPKRFFLVVDLSTGAAPARTVVVRASTGAFFSVTPPNRVNPDASFTSPPLNVNAPPTTMFVVAGSSAPASFTQGAPNVPMLALRVRTSAFSARWTQLRVTRTGAGQDSDVPSVKLYRDADGDGVLNTVADERLSTGSFSGGSALLSFATQTVTAATQTYFVTYDVKTTAVAGDTLGASIAAAGDLRVAAPDSVSTAGFPLQSGNAAVLATQAGLSVAGTNVSPGVLKQGATEQVLLSLSLQTTQFALTWTALTVRSTGSAADPDIKALSLWYDANLNGVVDAGTDTKITSGLNAFLGGTAVLSLSQPQEIGTGVRRYLLTADVAAFAEPGRTFAAVIPSAASFAVSAPNSVVNAGFPIQSDVNTTLRKLEEALVVAPADLVGSGINQGANLALARLDVRASRSRVGWNGLTVRQNGNLGAGEVTAVRVYRDSDGSGTLGAADLLIGSAAFSGSQAVIAFSSAQTVALSTQSYFLAVEPTLTATVGADIRLSVQAGDFLIAAPDAASAAGLPFNTGSAVVLDAKTPSQPVVTDDGAYSSDFEGLNFTWSSSVGTGTLAGAFYAVGTTPGGTDVRPFTPLAASQTSVRATGFPLLQAVTYYVTVKAQSSFGFNSPLGVSDGLLEDFSVPLKPAPSVTTGSGALLVTWASVPSGPSGILGYLVEYRTGESPVWFNAKTGLKTGVLALDYPGAAPFTLKGVERGTMRLLAVSTAALVTGGSFQAAGLPPGTLFVRVRAVAGSGVISTAAEPVKVQLGPLPKDGLSDASVFPNPFDSRKGSASIHFVLNQQADVGIKVYSVFGRQVREFSFSGGQAGSNVAQWDGADDSGRKVAKGMYIMVLESGGAKATVNVGVIH